MDLPLKTKLMVFNAVLGGFLFGYDTGVMSGSLVKLSDDKKDWDLVDWKKELIVSAAIWACAVGAIISGTLNKFFGRKITMMAGGLVLTVASLIMAVAPNWQTLTFGRALDGIAIGFVSMTGPLYIAEQVPSNWRGPLTVCNQLMITIGILVGSIIAGLFEPVNEGWRWMLGLSCIPSTLMTVMFIVMPKSARWLYFTGQKEEAKRVLITLRGTNDVTDEINEIAEDYARMNENERIGGKGFQILVNIVRNRAVRRALILGMFLQLFQQLSGINSVMYYSGTILVMSGMDSNKAIWLASIVSVANVLFTFIGLFGVESLGRKILLFGSMIVMMIGLTFLGIAFILIDNSSKDIVTTGYMDDMCNKLTCYACVNVEGCNTCPSASDPNTQYCYDSTVYKDVSKICDGGSGMEFCKTSNSWLAVLGLTIYIMGFAPGMGPLPWTINSETFPNWARDTAMSITTCTNWICNGIISTTFLQLSNAAGPSGAFFTYCGVTFIGLIYFFVFLPETKGLSLEHTEELFNSSLTFIGFKQAKNKPKPAEN